MKATESQRAHWRAFAAAALAASHPASVNSEEAAQQQLAKACGSMADAMLEQYNKRFNAQRVTIMTLAQAASTINNRDARGTPLLVFVRSVTELKQLQHGAEERHDKGHTVVVLDSRYEDATNEVAIAKFRRRDAQFCIATKHFMTGCDLSRDDKGFVEVVFTFEPTPEEQLQAVARVERP